MRSYRDGQTMPFRRTRMPWPSLRPRTERRPVGFGRSAQARRRPRASGEILTPGPIVDDVAMPFMYRPFADAGRARCSSSSTARVVPQRGSRPGSSPCPSGTCTLPLRSVRYSTLPPLNSETALPTSVGDGAGLRVRHEAARTEHATEPADLTHEVGRRDRDVEVHEAFVLHAVDEVFGADDVGARPRVPLRPRRPRRTPRPARPCPVPAGSETVPAQHLVGLAGIDTEPERGFDGLVELLVRHRLHELERLRPARAAPACRSGPMRRRTSWTWPWCRSFEAPSFGPVDPPARCSGGGQHVTDAV